MPKSWRIGLWGGFCGVLVGLIASSAPAGAGSEPLARVAFSSGGRIVTVAADGSERVQLSGSVNPRRGNAGDIAPTWSPDRLQVAFVRLTNAGEGDVESRIYVMDADGSDQHAITAPAAETYVADPEWSPDGQSLAFSRWRETDGELDVRILSVPLLGGAAETLVGTPSQPRRGFAFVGEPAWAPDGSVLAYTKTALRPRQNYEFHPSLHLIDADGSNKRRLHPDASAAAWSPDGARIAFSSIRDRNGEDCYDSCSFRPELYVMDADGTGLQRLTRNKGDDLRPDWSADGQRIVFFSDRNNRRGFGDGFELYSIEPGGDCLTWLTNGAPGSAYPDWEPDPAADSSPGACGARGLQPLVEFDADPLAGVSGFRPLWLGPRFGTRLLSYLDAGRDSAYLAYGDCGRFQALDCGPSVQINESSVCRRRNVTPLLWAETVMERRGALVAFGGIHRAHVVTGRTAMTAYFQQRPAGLSPKQLSGRIVRRLRPASHTSPPESLPAPALPTSLLGKLRRAVAAFERFGSFEAAADDLGVSTRVLRQRLHLARALDRFEHVRRVDCG